MRSNRAGRRSNASSRCAEHVMKSKTTAPPKKARVLLVDDHAVVRDGLAQLIQGEKDLAVCGEAASAEEAVDLAGRAKPNLAIVDISLGGVNGMELIKNLQALDRSLPILVLSMHDEMHY